MDEAEKAFSVFFKHLCKDMEATAEFAGRNTIMPTDLELIMKR